MNISTRVLAQLTLIRNAQFMRFRSAFACATKNLATATQINNKQLLVGGSSHTNFIAKQFSSNDTVNIPIVSYDEIKQLPKQPQKFLIDVREPKELEETGQIPTSINIPLGEVANELGPNADAGAFFAKYGRKLPNKNAELIFHCKIGKRSHSAAEIAKSLGFENSKNYLGSWTEWAEKEGLPK